MSYLAGLYDPNTQTLHGQEPQRYVGDGEEPSALSAVYDYEALSQDLDSIDEFVTGTNIGRFAPLLPITEPISIPSGPLESTPLKQMAVETDRTGTTRFIVKDETRHPGGTIWDRGSVIALSVAKEWGLDEILLGSDGPSAVSMETFVHKNGDTPLLLLDTDRPVRLDTDKTSGLVWTNSGLRSLGHKALAMICRYNFYLGIPGWNPYFMEGLKTTAYEIVARSESLPSQIYVGTQAPIVAQSILKGFRELSALGWLDEQPEVIRISLKNESAGNNLPDEIDLAQIGSIREESKRTLTADVPTPRTLGITTKTIRENQGFQRWVSGESTGCDLSLLLGIVGILEDDKESNPVIINTGAFSLPQDQSLNDIIELKGDVTDLPETLPKSF